jgi:hypothetical protein
MKTQTLIFYPNNDIALKMDFLYHPLECIIINCTEYFYWDQYDELDNNGILRRILLKTSK